MRQQLEVLSWRRPRRAASQPSPQPRQRCQPDAKCFLRYCSAVLQDISTHHVEGTLGQVIELASKDLLDKISLARISWMDKTLVRSICAPGIRRWSQQWGRACQGCW